MAPEADTPLPRLLWITDRTRTNDRPLENVCAQFLKGAERVGAQAAVMLREKDLTGGAMFELAAALREITRRHGAALLVNSRIDVAIAAEADGAHLPQNDLPAEVARELLGDRLLGVSCHTLDEACAAQDAGADYITLGPVYDTMSKRQYGAPLGVDALRSITQELAIPVFGLGGITISNASAVTDAGAYGIACIGAIATADDPADAAATLAACVSSPAGARYAT